MYIASVSIAQYSQLISSQTSVSLKKRLSVLKSLFVFDPFRAV